MTAVLPLPTATRTSWRDSTRCDLAHGDHGEDGGGGDLAHRVQALVADAVSGDARAVGRILELVRPAVLRYCRTRLSAHETGVVTADDVAQEVCIAIMHALGRYRGSDDMPFLGFVYGIAAHKVADVRRAAARNRAVTVETVPEVGRERYERGPEELVLSFHRRARLAALLGTLSGRHRTVLVMRVVMGLSAAETATAIGTTPGAVRVAQYRALTRLREAMASEPAGGVLDRAYG